MYSGFQPAGYSFTLPLLHSLQLFGDGAIAQAVLSGSADRGEVMTINVGWAVGVMMGAYVSIGITGGHMNPAVTFAMALRGKLSWLKVSSGIVRKKIFFLRQCIVLMI